LSSLLVFGDFLLVLSEVGDFLLDLVQFIIVDFREICFNFLEVFKLLALNDDLVPMLEFSGDITIPVDLQVHVLGGPIVAEREGKCVIVNIQQFIFYVVVGGVFVEDVVLLRDLELLILLQEVRVLDLALVDGGPFPEIAHLVAQIHVVYLDQPLQVQVRRQHKRYDGAAV